MSVKHVNILVNLSLSEENTTPPNKSTHSQVLWSRSTEELNLWKGLDVI